MSVLAPQKPSYPHQAANIFFSLAHEAARPVHWSTYRIYCLNKTLQEKKEPASSWEKIAYFAPEILLALGLTCTLVPLSLGFSTLGSLFQLLAGKNYLEIQVGNPESSSAKDLEKLVVYNQNVGCLPGNISQDATVAPAEKFNVKTQEQRREKAVKILIEKLLQDADVITLQETQDRNFLQELTKQAKKQNLNFCIYTHFKDPWKMGIDAGITVISKCLLDVEAKALPSVGPFGQWFLFPKYVVSFSYGKKKIATTHLLPGKAEKSREGRQKQLKTIRESFQKKSLVLIGDVNLRGGEKFPSGFIEIELSSHSSTRKKTMFIEDKQNAEVCSFEKETRPDRVATLNVPIDQELVSGQVLRNEKCYSDHQMLRVEIKA